MTNNTSTLRLAQIFNSYARMLERSMIDGHGNHQIIVDSCIDRMHIEWLEARCEKSDARFYCNRMIKIAAKYNIRPVDEEALHAIDALNDKWTVA